MKIAFTSGAWRDWNKLPSKIQIYLKEKLLFYSSNPLKYAVKLTNLKIGQYRFRIGDYRVVFDISKDELIIIAVGHRKNIYR